MSNNPVLTLVVHNLPLLGDYLKASPIMKMKVCAYEDDDSPPCEFEVNVPSVLPSTVGMVQRCGIVKLKIIQLLECIIDKLSLNLIHPVIMTSIHTSILVYLLFIYRFVEVVYKTSLEQYSS